MARGEAHKEVIQSLWVGGRLSLMERISIASFLAAGHRFHLYTYGEVEGVPEGAEVRNGAEILPESMIFQYRDRPSFSAFSNFFRYKLLLERGGWWADTDVVCLRPFDLADEVVVASEDVRGKSVAASAVLKMPAGHPAMHYAWEFCSGADRDALRWGEAGPKLLGEAVDRFSLRRHVQPARVFCPIPYSEWERVLEDGARWEADDETRGLHLWNEMWRREGRNKNAGFAEDCLYARLARRFG